MSRLTPNGLLIEHGDGKPPEGEVRPTIGCRHCQATVLSKTADKNWGYCYQCNSLVCEKCFARGACRPWEELFERLERRYESRKSMGLT